MEDWFESWGRGGGCVHCTVSGTELTLRRSVSVCVSDPMYVCVCVYTVLYTR
jgi:hypothetical protein